MPLSHELRPLSTERIAELEPALSDLQANILTGLRCDHASYGFVRFSSPEVQTLRRAIAAIPLTSAFENRPGEEISRPVLTLGLTFSGLTALQLPEPFGGFEETFKKGFRHYVEATLKESTDGWRRPFAGSRLDALITVATPDALVVHSAMENVTAILGNAADIEWQPGFVRRNDAGRPVEHFGFVDGISQPVFLESDAAEHSSGEPDGVSFPLRSVLRQQGMGGGPYWSYFAFLKLEQNVEAFEKAVDDLAGKVSVEGCPREYARALICGRYRDGRPVLEPSTYHNNFSYAGDPYGKLCPLASHIRKMNPRTTTTMGNRIARRGVLYEDGPGERGVLFQCYQGSLQDQFEILMNKWGRACDIFERGAGMDPLLGTSQSTPQTWPQSPGGAKVEHKITSLVTIRGGEYFYVPSLSLVKRLRTS